MAGDWLVHQGPPRASPVGNTSLFVGESGYAWVGGYIKTAGTVHRLPNLYNVHNRFYSPEWGRWIARDPAGLWFDALELGNGYGYGGASPATRADPTGLGNVLPGGDAAPDVIFNPDGSIRELDRRAMDGAAKDAEHARRAKNSFGNPSIGLLDEISKEQATKYGSGRWMPDDLQGPVFGGPPERPRIPYVDDPSVFGWLFGGAVRVARGAVKTARGMIGLALDIEQHIGDTTLGLLYALGVDWEWSREFWERAQARAKTIGRTANRIREMGWNDFWYQAGRRFFRAWRTDPKQVLGDLAGGALVGGALFRALRFLKRLPFFKPPTALSQVKKWLGEDMVIKHHDAKKFVAMSRDGTRKLRLDFEGHGDVPHAHLEVLGPDGKKWKPASGTPHRIPLKEGN